MKKIYSPLFQLLTFLFSFALQAQLVSTTSELSTALSNASAGSTIILANGTWTDVQISINKTGTSDNPITIKAETAGSVFFEGNSYVKMGGQYIYFEGVVFQNPSDLSVGTSIITFKSSDECQYCQVKNVKIDTYNGTSDQSTSTFKWVLLYGDHNEISYCSFLGKYGVGSIINDNRTTSTEDYTKIHHNYFAHRTPVGEVNDLNDQDAIRIGNSATSQYDSYTEVYDNYFDDFSGEIEVISNKSCHNKYYNNTFRDYQGCLTLRHGNDCEVYNNFFIANNKNFSGGIRVIGENHKIYNNYIEGINSKKSDGSSSNGTGGINVSNGRVDSALNGYLQVKNVTIINNTFVNCDYGFRIGTKISSDLTLAPENLIIANNIIADATTNAIQETTAPTGTSSIYEGNIKQNGTWDITTDENDNTSVTSGLIATTKTDFYRLITGSTAIGSGLGSYSYLTEDVTGGARPSSGFSVGAEEFNSGGILLPYTSSDVGVTVGFINETGTLGVATNVLENNEFLLYPVPTSGNYLNISYGTNLGQIKIIDMQGRVLFDNVINNTTGVIDLSFLAKGVYVLKFKGGSKTFIKS
jgi:poly(beta-D-mannuronate) lyase